MTNTTKSYQLVALELGPMENFIYLIKDLKTQRTAVVDPAWEVDDIIQTAAKQNMKITDILLTHSHHDHINGITGILDNFDAELHLLKPEAQFWGQTLDLPKLHHGGDVITLGNTTINILHTPGHTPGSACYMLDDDIITGDTLFVFGCGRCDLSGGDPEIMHQTLRQLRTELPASTIVHPGHNYAIKTTSTMAEECDGNPFLQLEDKAEFVHYRMHLHDKCRHSPYQPEKRKS
jgi:hydroxyacylglutathione hydrolase